MYPFKLRQEVFFFFFLYFAVLATFQEVIYKRYWEVPVCLISVFAQKYTL